MVAEAGALLASTFYRYDHGEFEMLAIECRRLSDYSLTVHDDARWLRRDELTALRLAPADVELISALEEAGVW